MLRKSDKRLYQTVVLIATLFMITPVWSEEPEVKASDPEQPPPAEATAAAEQDESEFDPTEEIIEDYSVPFPVDI